MAIDYEGISSDVQTLIADVGWGITLRKPTPSGTTYDPSIVNTDTTVYGVETRYHINEIDGLLIKSTDKKFLLNPTNVVPEIGDKILDGTNIYEIINVDPIQPGGVVVLYKVQARK